MRPWVGNLIGLVLGFVIGGEALYIYLSTHRGAPEPAAVSAPRIEERPAPPQVLQPVELPRVIAPSPSAPDPMPQVIYPETPRPGPQRKPGSAMAGTGFFVSSDGSLITAAHVVTGCERIRVMSSMVKLSAAETLALDTIEDIALLRASHVTPPATLPIGHPASATARLFVLGYPGSGGLLIPTETWAVLENARMQPAPAKFVDPGRIVWAEAPTVAHGFSGGPMLDPRNGAVVGIVRGMVDSKRLHAERASIPATGMVIGPGSSPLAAMLRQEGTITDAIALTGDEALDAARRATVHVLCLY